MDKKSQLQALGGIVLIAGVAAFAYAFTMDVTVPTGTEYGRVANIHLIATQSKWQNAGMFGIFLGIVLFVAGNFVPNAPAEAAVGTAASNEESALTKNIDPTAGLSDSHKQYVAMGIGFVILACVFKVVLSAV